MASDKQFTELTASSSGVIRRIYYKEEDVCQVGDLFLEIFVEEEGTLPNKEAPASPAYTQSGNVVVEKKAEERITSSDIVATPFVRGLIKRHNLDATKIKGTGEGGRIIEVDIENILNQKQETKTHKHEIK